MTTYKQWFHGEPGRQDWSTPDDLFQKLNKIYNFTCDVCASKENTKCEKFYSEKDSCFANEWSGVCWMNPPFNRVERFVREAFEQRANATTVCLVPARTNTKWWHTYCMKGEISFICGRPKFGSYKTGLQLPLALVVFSEGINPGVVKSFYL